MPDGDDDLAALKEQTSHGDRIEEATVEETRQAFVDDILEELAAIEAGEQQKTVSVWDGPMAAFVRALEDNPDRLTEVGHALQQQLDLPEEDVDRSTALRLALRLGFKEAAPRDVDAVREAVQQQAIERF